MNVPTRRPKTTLGTPTTPKARTPARRPAAGGTTRKNPSLATDRPTIDPAGAWLNAHPKEVARYQELGGIIAVHGTLGIVAHGKSLTDAVKKVERLGLGERVEDEVTYSPARW